ncbi:hypothetical protein M9H77_23719 [Catharanthus roseus]|uniref:Uncharacterized protein n=1 Tax=Catharanthus roseus TaxID=4058 RepID=A0ACC0AY64_CATRO|nr:hypothetical protein M9H77_23719 [Catharanthus roseus]
MLICNYENLEEAVQPKVTPIGILYGAEAQLWLMADKMLIGAQLILKGVEDEMALNMTEKVDVKNGSKGKSFEVRQGSKGEDDKDYEGESESTECSEFYDSEFEQNDNEILGETLKEQRVEDVAGTSKNGEMRDDVQEHDVETQTQQVG